MNFRIGFGIDVHRFSQDRKLILGGIEIPSDKGLMGHSDADVTIHAICDALLGAAGLRDIGFHFPDTDPAFKDADSKKLLASVADLMHQKGWLIGNIDCTIALQSPKISSHIPEMQKVLAAILAIEPENLSIKATTTEGLGYEGRLEGVTAYAVVLIYRDSSSTK
ncbi:MAG TPA: 2-C-methyl-D-erythritol 2,4-cyclodiphosphate synthase [Bacteroidales bacterium]|nr:2-C-methyl-D-erythritol 2,4-cyclodiphosphate synthase [Bacteroidales bacterium]